MKLQSYESFVNFFHGLRSSKSRTESLRNSFDKGLFKVNVIILTKCKSGSTDKRIILSKAVSICCSPSHSRFEINCLVDQHIFYIIAFHHCLCPPYRQKELILQSFTYNTGWNSNCSRCVTPGNWNNADSIDCWSSDGCKFYWGNGKFIASQIEICLKAETYFWTVWAQEI